jgi:hypothetical protein
MAAGNNSFTESVMNRRNLECSVNTLIAGFMLRCDAAPSLAREPARRMLVAAANSRFAAEVFMNHAG